MDGGGKLGIEDELSYGREGAHVGVVGGVGAVRLVEGKLFEYLGEISKGPSCYASFGLLEGFE